MNLTQARFPAVTSLLLAASILISTAATAAETLDVVTIRGTKATRQLVGRSPTTGAPLETVALSRAVDYSDLDLSTTKGARELGDRVGAAAKAVCGELDKEFPLMGNDPNCVKKVTEDGMKQVDRLVKAHETAR